MSHASPKQGLRRWQDHAPALYPGVILFCFFVIPFGIMLAVSFFHRPEGGFYEVAFELDNYAKLFTPFFGRVLGFSLGLSTVAAGCCVILGFPFTYLLTRLRRRSQILWLVFILSVLSLSEVIMGFAWSTLLSRTAGVSNLFVALGLMEKAVSWSPSLGALICGMCFLTFPYTVLMFYPPLSRIDNEMIEASATMGAAPAYTFFHVTVGAMRDAIVSVFVMAFVFTLGAYLLPQLLGRPQHWTLSVLITDQAMYRSNMPQAAAMAVFLMLVSLALVALVMTFGKRKKVVRQ